MTKVETHGGEPHRTTREFTYRRTSRFTLAVTDPAAVAEEAVQCRAAHGRRSPQGSWLPPTVNVKAPDITESQNSEDVEVMNDPVLGGVWRLIECGRHGVVDGTCVGVTANLANHSGEMGPWPPWPVSEAL